MNGYLDRDGYVRVSVGRRTQYEHRVIMAAIVGRPLRRDEHVHHRNGVRSDNRPENLELLTASVHVGSHNRAAPKRRRGQHSAYDVWVLNGRVGPRPERPKPKSRGEVLRTYWLNKQARNTTDSTTCRFPAIIPILTTRTGTSSVTTG